MTRERRKTIALSITTSVLLLVLFAMGLHWFGMTGSIFSDSEAPGVYRMTSGPFVPGQMVATYGLLKHLVAGPGDVVRVTPGGSYINGKLWPFSAPVLDGRYKPYAFGTYKLQANQFWLLGLNPESFDSRYFGIVPADYLRSVVRPVLTFSNGYAPGTTPWSK